MILPPTYATEHHFKKATFTDEDIGHRDFLSEIILEECEFDGTTLSESTFSDCIFIKCTFKTTCLWDTTFSDCLFDECNFSEGIWTTGEFEDCEFNKCEFSQMMNMTDIEFVGCKITESLWSETINSHDEVKFTRCQITSVTFLNFLIEGYKFENCSIVATRFSCSDINKTHFEDCRISGCHLTNCDFNKTIFERVFFKNSKFCIAKFDKSVKMRDVSCTDTTFIQCEIPLSVTDGITVEPTTSTSREKGPASSVSAASSLLPPPIRLACGYSNTTPAPPTKPKMPEPVKNKLRAYRFCTSGI